MKERHVNSFGAGEMAWVLKMLAMETWRPEFILRIGIQVEERANSIKFSSVLHRHAVPSAHAYIHILNKFKNKSYKKSGFNISKICNKVK